MHISSSQVHRRVCGNAQVREKKAQKEAQKRREREADEREERRAREGHAQLVAQAMAQTRAPVIKQGPFGEASWQGVAAEGSQDVVLGAAGVCGMLCTFR